MLAPASHSRESLRRRGPVGWRGVSPARPHQCSSSAAASTRRVSSPWRERVSSVRSCSRRRYGTWVPLRWVCRRRFLRLRLREETSSLQTSDEILENSKLSDQRRSEESEESRKSRTINPETNGDTNLAAERIHRPVSPSSACRTTSESRTPKAPAIRQRFKNVGCRFRRSMSERDVACNPLKPAMSS